MEFFTKIKLKGGIVKECEFLNKIKSANWWLEQLNILKGKIGKRRHVIGGEENGRTNAKLQMNNWGMWNGMGQMSD